MNYDLDRFKKDFIDIDFDDMLIQQNNELVNSNNHYLQHKDDYFLKTNINYTNFKKLYEKYSVYMNNHVEDHLNKKFRYTYVNKETLNSINEQLKTILLEQRTLYKVFIDYINFFK
jgi:hypothetical protein